MLEKYINKKVEVRYTGYSTGFYMRKGIITNIDDNFIEIDNNLMIARKYIVHINAL